jgi:hypothetical protein
MTKDEDEIREFNPTSNKDKPIIDLAEVIGYNKNKNSKGDLNNVKSNKYGDE